MIQTMKTDSFFTINLNVERILFVILIILSITLTALFKKQNSEIKQLKSDMAIQRNLYRNLEVRVDDLESQNTDLESKINDVESRVYEFGSNSNYY